MIDIPGIRVEEAMTKKPVIVSPDESVLNLAKTMNKKDIGSMVVSQKEKLKGIITSEDLVKRVLIPNKDQICSY